MRKGGPLSELVERLHRRPAVLVRAELLGVKVQPFVE